MKTGFVYLIRPIGLPGPVKIGFTLAAPSRLMALAEWSPLKLEMVATIPGSMALERNIHDCLWKSHSHHEWFHPTDEVTRFVAKVIAGVPIEKAIDLAARGAGRARPRRTRHPSSVLRDWRYKARNYADRHGQPMIQTDLATALGIAPSQVSQIETGKRCPSLGLAAKIAKLTGIPIEFLAVDRDVEAAE